MLATCERTQLLIVAPEAKLVHVPVHAGADDASAVAAVQRAFGQRHARMKRVHGIDGRVGRHVYRRVADDDGTDESVGTGPLLHNKGRFDPAHLERDTQHVVRSPWRVHLQQLPEVVLGMDLEAVVALSLHQRPELICAVLEIVMDHVPSEPSPHDLPARLDDRQLRERRGGLEVHWRRQVRVVRGWVDGTADFRGKVLADPKGAETKTVRCHLIRRQLLVRCVDVVLQAELLGQARQGVAEDGVEVELGPQVEHMPAKPVDHQLYRTAYVVPCGRDPNQLHHLLAKVFHRP
mmetsp:Transcript_36424/g.84212  ORF Transcript_36424/g.84212 Transcript_36424/m.84212 type:complete len:292 (+) Transcript_36424:292-1167(+)